MVAQSTQQTIRDALSQFETCLVTPIVPGELPQWCQSAWQANQQLDRELRTAVEQRHPPLLDEIQVEDPGLATRVQHLKEEDERLLAELAGITEELGRLGSAASAVEPDERLLDDEVRHLTDRGLALVLAVRKQEAAITTWLEEAFERDRGDVD